jgi:hypothetical protein
MVANQPGPDGSLPPNVLTDALPPGTTFVSETHSGSWTCTAPAVGGTGTITCTDVTAINPQQTFIFTFVFHLSPSITAGTTITNTATISAAGPDPDLTNNSSSAMTAVIAPTFDTCLVDNTTGNLLQWNSTTGAYKFTRCSDGFMITGSGVVKLVNGIQTLTDFKSSIRLSAGFNTGQLTGNATIYVQVVQGVWQSFRIVDTNPNAVCACPG